MSEYVLIHHGIKGQKWGVRRYQNPDGTLTEAGKKRNYKLEERKTKDIDKGKSEKTVAENAEYRNKINEYKDNESVLNKIAKTIFMGPLGTYNYNRSRAVGHSRLGAMIKTSGIQSLSSLPGGLLQLGATAINPVAGLAVSIANVPASIALGIKANNAANKRYYSRLSEEAKKSDRERITK